jgi:signal peptidase I
MTKRKSNTPKPSDPSNASAPSQAAGRHRDPANVKAAGHMPSAAAIRETIEQVVIALVLAFLFRTFEAEAFVIPTGSMATTLMGRHKDLVCPKCGAPYQLNASEEVDSLTGASRNTRIEYGTCPMCRWTAYLGPGNLAQENYPSYTGDRILVDKFAYEWDDPQRWDVAVFKYPGEAKTNYIKRVAGLPGETVRIASGDLYVKRAGEAEYKIARKPPNKVVAMLRRVYDNDCIAEELVSRGWPLRWQAVDSSTSGAWRTSDDHHRLSTDGTGDDVWVRYHHYVPTYNQWQSNARPREPRAQLITDFAGYNTASGSLEGSVTLDNLGLHWVGDLAIECEVVCSSTSGTLGFELVKGGRRFTCRVELATGRATLAIEGVPDFQPSATTAFRGAGTHSVRFSNVDRQLVFWVDGRPVAFDRPTTYADLGNHRPQAADLTPVGIQSQRAAVEIRRLRLCRDVYYLSGRTAWLGRSTAMADYQPPLADPTPDDIAAFLSDPRRWDVFENLATSEFTMGPGQFFMLGDNSGYSADGRLWGQKNVEHYVKRELLTGRALYIYWPHSFDEVNVFGLRIPLPFFPNFSRMEFVR